MGHTTPPGWPPIIDEKFYCVTIHVYCLLNGFVDDKGLHWECLAGNVLNNIIDQGLPFFPIACAPAEDLIENIVAITGPYDIIGDCIAICHA